jgi:hypothetical protein
MVNCGMDPYGYPEIFPSIVPGTGTPVEVASSVAVNEGNGVREAVCNSVVGEAATGLVSGACGPVGVERA